MATPAAASDEPGSGPVHRETPQAATLRLSAGADAERAVVVEMTSSWAAMHRLAQWVGTEGPSMPLARIELSDPGGRYGAAANRTSQGTWELTFQSEEAAAMYRHVVRERQLEIARPAENRVEAAAPERQETARAARRENEPDRQPSARERMQQQLLDQLMQVGPRSTDSAQTELSADVVHQVLQRASPEQLQRLSERSQAEPAALRDTLHAVQREIGEAVVDRTGSTGQNRRSPEDAPPVEERFTAQQRWGRTDYWMRDRPDRIAFTQTWLSLRTAQHSPAVILGMVDRAVELGWKRIHLDGSAEFKREAWIQAQARGITALGYTATVGDREAVEAERKRLQSDRPVRTEAAQLRRGPEHERWDGKARADIGPSPEQLRQWVRRAIADGRAVPSLEDRLVEILRAELHRRSHDRRVAPLHVWDPKSPPTQPRRRPVADRTHGRNLQRDR